MKIATPREKSQPPLSQQPTFKSWGPVKAPPPPQPLVENLVGDSIPPVEKTGGGAHYDTMIVFDSYSRMSKGVRFK